MGNQPSYYRLYAPAGCHGSWRADNTTERPACTDTCMDWTSCSGALRTQQGQRFGYPAAPARATLCATRAAFFTDRASGWGWHVCGTGHGMPMLIGKDGNTKTRDARNQHQQSQSCRHNGNVRPDEKHSSRTPAWGHTCRVDPTSALPLLVDLVFLAGCRASCTSLGRWSRSPPSSVGRVQDS